MAKLYTVGTRKQKKIKWDLMLGFVVVVVIVAAYIVFRVFSESNTLQVDNTKNQPQTRVIGATTGPETKVDEKLFSMTLPGEWEEWVEEGGHEAGIYRYKELGVEGNGRYIVVYIDSLPRPDDLYMTHVLPVTTSGDDTKLNPDAVSDLCREFASIDEKEITEVVDARWKNIEFDCDTHRYRNIVGTASEKDGYQVPLGSDTSNQHTFFFHYTDHGIRPNNQIFVDIIKSFQAK